MWEKFAPRHRTRDMAHAQWLQMHCQWYPMGDVRTHNSVLPGCSALATARMVPESCQG